MAVKGRHRVRRVKCEVEIVKDMITSNPVTCYHVISLLGKHLSLISNQKTHQCFRKQGLDLASMRETKWIRLPSRTDQIAAIIQIDSVRRQATICRSSSASKPLALYSLGHAIELQPLLSCDLSCSQICRFVKAEIVVDGQIATRDGILTLTSNCVKRWKYSFQGEVLSHPSTVAQHLVNINTIMVGICDASTVFPSRPVEENVIKLSLTDVYSPKVWVMQTHFWSCEETDTIKAAYTSLKQGLGRTLSEIPGLAGRTGRTSDDPRDLVVLVNDTAHVEFPLDDHTMNTGIPSYADLKQAGFPMTSLIQPFAMPVMMRAVSEGAPMLAVKFNVLKGGMALSFGFNHLLADATSIAEVERIWSLHTADASAGIEQRTHKGSGDDEATRVRLSTPSPTTTTFESPYWKVFPTQLSQLVLPKEAQATETALKMVHKAKEEHWAAKGPQIDAPKWCMWYFGPAQLTQLKADCSVDLASGEWVSTMDALVGLFWSRILLLLKNIQGDQQKSTLLFPVNIRSRLDPPLHPQYIGNAVDIVATEVPIADLQDDSSKSWAAAARALRTAVTGWKQESWESWLAMAKALPNEEAICPNPLMLLDQHNIAFNDYSRSKSNTLDWGQHIGVADRTRYMKPAGSMKGCATGVVVFPRLADGGLEVATTSTDGLRDALAADEVFSKYAKLECAFA